MISRRIDHWSDYTSDYAYTEDYDRYDDREFYDWYADLSNIGVPVTRLPMLW